MSYLRECNIRQILYGIDRILSKVYLSIFKNSEPHKRVTKEGSEILWTPECQNNFQLLKELFACAPVLQIANLDKEYIVCTDASLEGLGGVLMQEGLVIYYESRKLKVHENNYAMHNLELVFIVRTHSKCGDTT